MGDSSWLGIVAPAEHAYGNTSRLQECLTQTVPQNSSQLAY